MDTFAEEIREYLGRAAKTKRARPDLQAPTPAVRSDPAPQPDMLPDAVIDARLGDSLAVTDLPILPLSDDTRVAVEEDLPGATAADRSGDHPIATALVDMASTADETMVFGHQAPWFTGPADPVDALLEMRTMLDAIDRAFEVASVGPETGAIVAPDQPLAAIRIDEERATIPAPEGFVEPGPPPCDAPNEPLVRVRPAVKARARTRTTARKTRADVPDDWSYFDPAQCRFAALVAKLDEIAAESQATSPKSRT